MVTVTTDQARKRFTTIPPRLQEALFSIQNAEIVNQIADQNHILPEKAGKIADVGGWVLLGFIHPEDAAKELQEAMGLPAQTATAIADSLNAKIFGPLQGELTRAYAPALHKEEAALVPKIIQDIGPAPLTTKPAGPPTPTPPAVAAKPKLPEVGWSRMTPAVPTPPVAAPPARGPIGEFERLTTKRGESVAPAAVSPTGIPKPPSPPTPVTPAMPPLGPAPVILHEDTSTKPQQPTPDFHLDLPSEKFAMQKGSAPLPIKPAVVELGKPPPPPAPKTVVSTPRVVHYTEYKSPSPEAPIPPSTATQRKITELTAPGTAPPVPPKASSSPKPSAPPMPPKALPPESTPPELPGVSDSATKK